MAPPWVACEAAVGRALRPLAPRPLARDAEAANALGEPRSWSEAVARLARLRDLTHLSVEHLDCRGVLDARGVTHVLTHVSAISPDSGTPETITEWITLAKYARRYARHVNVSLLRMAEAGLICDSWIPELKIEMVRRVRTGAGGVLEEPPAFVAPKRADAGWKPIGGEAGPAGRQPREKAGRFRVPSFDDGEFGAELGTVLRKLCLGRDSFDSVELDLRGNGGGGNTAPYLMARCLAGGGRPWMKRERVRELSSPGGAASEREWDPWRPDLDPNEAAVLRRMGLGPGDRGKASEFWTALGRLDAPYSGRVALLVDHECGSATWFLVTLLVYALGGRVARGRGTICGVPVKVGSFSPERLRLAGRMSVQGIDGNAARLQCRDARGRGGGRGAVAVVAAPKTVVVTVPTQVRLASSVRRQDWGRFWQPNAKGI